MLTTAAHHLPQADAPEPAATPPKTIVCGIDGGTNSGEIVRIAAELAAVMGAHCEIVHVLDSAPIGTDTASIDQRRLHGRAMLDALSDANGPQVKGLLIDSGDPARRIAAVAESAAASLIVVGTRSAVQRVDAHLGSVSARLAADAPCPVLVVPFALQSHVRPSMWMGRTVVCGYDDSQAGWQATLVACTFAQTLAGRLHLVTVDHAPAWRLTDVVIRLCRRLESMESATLAVDTEHRSGDPAWELERVARALTAPFIAIGSRGQGPWHQPLIGSVARQILLSGRLPVLVVPTTSGEPS